jgi:NTP pyrophosphatase (non-canonical NTP hydrolase)
MTHAIDAYASFTESMWFSGKPGEPTKEHDLPIMALGLAGESGEVIEHIKKLIRDDYLDHDALKKELGDVAFYWARICRYFGFWPSEVLAANVAKLESRRERGKLRGDGDDR